MFRPRAHPSLLRGGLFTSMEQHMSDISDAFPSGVIVFFRLVVEGQLARSIHPTGRSVSYCLEHYNDDDYIVFDGAGKFLAAFPRDFVAAILPLETTGPANADKA